MFPGRSSTKPLSTKQVQLRFEVWKIAAGLRSELTIHSFRSGFATRLHQVSRSPLLVSRALGHRDPTTTARYIAEDQTALKEALEKAFG
jgi:integrase